MVGRHADAVREQDKLLGTLSARVDSLAQQVANEGFRIERYLGDAVKAACQDALVAQTETSHQRLVAPSFSQSDCGLVEALSERVESLRDSLSTEVRVREE